MHSLITSYLIQNKECVLPGIGILKIIHTPASTDAVNSRILPPFESILFKNEEGSASRALVKYIAQQRQSDQNEAEKLLVDFFKEWKDKIDEGGRLNLETLGSIGKNADGMIIFDKDISPTFLRPITFNNIYHKSQPEEEHTLSETRESSAIVEVAGPEAVVVEKSYWGIWALILLAIGFVMLFYHYKAQKLTGYSIGNQYRFSVDSAGTSYKLPK